MTQGEFLNRLGIATRAAALAEGKDEESRQAIAAAVERLAGTKMMGTLFKVLAVAAPGLTLPGIDRDS
jgi:NADH dehydrogenase [ubiquinone] 1 alpha subcomplex assembly factor 7